MSKDKTVLLSILLEQTTAELAEAIIRLRAELEETQLKLTLARVSLKDNQATIKRKSQALRNISLQRRSLRQTVKRRRKHTK